MDRSRPTWLSCPPEPDTLTLTPQRSHNLFWMSRATSHRSRAMALFQLQHQIVEQARALDLQDQRIAGFQCMENALQLRQVFDRHAVDGVNHVTRLRPFAQ